MLDYIPAYPSSTSTSAGKDVKRELRGEPVPLEWMNWLLRDWLAGGYHLRMDTTHIYLYFGYEDLVMVLPRLGRSRDLASRTLTNFIYRHARRRISTGRRMLAQTKPLDP